MARRNNEIIDIEVEPFEVEYIPPLPFKDCFEKFILDCQIRNLRSHTIQYYTNEMRCFYKYLRELDISLDMKKFTNADLKEITLHMLSTDLKVTSINTRLRAIRSFFNFLVREGEIERENNPVADIKLLKDRVKVVDTYTNKEIYKLFKQPNLKLFTGIRDLTVMMLFLETGVRVNEMTYIKKEHLQFEHNRILITNTKGYKQRFVPMQEDMQKQLKTYLHVRGAIEDHTYLFVSIDDTPMTKHAIQVMVSKYGKQVGIRATCHKFRHTFGRICAENGASIFELQAILGHSSLEMVKHYVNLFSNDVIKKHENFSPISGLKKKR